MLVKKILSLLTLLFLVFFLIVSAFPDEGDDPIPDADPWDETTVKPVDKDEPVILVVSVSMVPFVPYFIILFERVPAPSTPKATRGYNSPYSRGSSLVGR